LRSAFAVLTPCATPKLFDSRVSQCAVLFDEGMFDAATAARLDVPLPEKLDSAVRKRKAEYVAGRVCAVRAVRTVSPQFDGTIDVSSAGLPVWIDTIVGSITHTKGFASAAVARARRRDRFRSDSRGRSRLGGFEVRGDAL
jgi:enterobactin synthetase component D